MKYIKPFRLVESFKSFRPVDSSDPFWTVYTRLAQLGMVSAEDWSKIQWDDCLQVKERLAGHYPDLDVEKLAFDEIRIYQRGRGGSEPYYSVFIRKGLPRIACRDWDCRLMLDFQQVPGTTPLVIRVPAELQMESAETRSLLISRRIIRWMDENFIPLVGVEADRVTESAEEVAAARRMLDLGLIDTADFTRSAKETGLASEIRLGFITLAKDLFRSLGLEWRDVATQRQAANDTVVLQLTTADIAELLFTATPPAGLTPRQASKFAKIRLALLPLQRTMEMGTKPERPNPFDYWILPGSLRNSTGLGTPSSNRIVEWDGLSTPEEALARFLYQVALDAASRSWRWRP